MGKEVEKVAISRGHEITGKIDIDNVGDVTADFLREADVVIEFTSPDAAADNYQKCFDAGVPVVSGTTGWYDKLPEVKRQCKEKNGTFLYASNFSIGVNIFFEVNRYLAKLMAGIKQYKPSVYETHHIHKLDKPSGTAITIANIILENNKELKEWKLDGDGNGILPVYSFREGEVVGEHKVKYESDIDEITLEHKAFSRQGFAQGAVIAAEFVKDRKGCYTMDDLMRSFGS